MSTIADLLEAPRVSLAELRSELDSIPRAVASGVVLPASLDVTACEGGLKVLMHFSLDAEESMGWVRFRVLHALVCRVLDRADPHHRQVIIVADAAA